MAKTKTTKFQTYPQPYQFGGLNLPFLDQYTNLNKQWGNFWQGGNYFGTTPTGERNKLQNTLGENLGATTQWNQVQSVSDKHYKGTWDNKAHDFYYNQHLDNNNPNRTQEDRDNFNKYSSFYDKNLSLNANDRFGALNNAGININDYKSWEKNRKNFQDQAGYLYDKGQDYIKTETPKAKKAMGAAMTDSMAGIFSGLNYMNAYTPPEEINLQQGSKGIMYAQDGALVKGPGLQWSPMMNNFGGKKVKGSRWTHFPDGKSAINALDTMLLGGKSKIYKDTDTAAQALKKFDPLLGNTADEFSKYTLAQIKKDPVLKTKFLQHIIQNEVPASDFNSYYAPELNRLAQFSSLGPSIMDYQVTSRQKGGIIKISDIGRAKKDIIKERNEKIIKNNPEQEYTGEFLQALMGLNPVGGLISSGVMAADGKPMSDVILNSIPFYSLANKIKTTKNIGNAFLKTSAAGLDTKDIITNAYQEGGNVNLEGYTPGTPSMNNDMNEIPSGDITMEQTPIPLLAIGKGGADNGLLKLLQPNSKGYNFKSKSTVEIPLEQQTKKQMIPQFQFGGSINDEHSVPVFSSNLEQFGLTELQTEKGEVGFMPDGSIVDVKAKESHKKQHKHNVSDIMQSGTYVFSDDPKMKFGIKSKIGGVDLGDMKLGKSVFKYKENEITPGPEDIMLKNMFFNGSKKELTTADIAKNIKKNLPIIDMKNDYFADRAIAENKDQRLEYLSILKAFNEFKKPKQKNIPKAQYGMPIQPTQNGLDGVMGYGDKQMDPYKKMDNNILSMWNIPQPKLPEIPNMYEYGGNIEHAQLGKLLKYTIPGAYFATEWYGNKKKKEQEKENALLANEAKNYRDTLQQGVNTAGGIGVGTNLATYAAALNVPLQKYDDQSEQMAMYNAAATRAAQRLEASKYTALQGIGSASSLARYSNPVNYGDYLAKVQSQSDGNIGKINQAIADLEMSRATSNVGFISARNAGRNQSLNTRDSQLYNANIQGLGNVGQSMQTAVYNTADTKYRLGNEKMAYDSYLKDKAIAAKQKVIQEFEGVADTAGQIGLTALTGGFGKLNTRSVPETGISSRINSFDTNSFNTGQNFSMSPINQRFNNNYNGLFNSYSTQIPGSTVNRNGDQFMMPMVQPWMFGG